MLTGIYTKNRHGKNIYMFRVGVYPFKIWLYVLNSREAAEASHRQIAGIKSEVDTIFAFIRAGLEYDKIEPHAKILAELVRGTWPPDKLYDYLKMLFLLILRALSTAILILFTRTTWTWIISSNFWSFIYNSLIHSTFFF
mgnify:CR=1 FL=1